MNTLFAVSLRVRARFHHCLTSITAEIKAQHNKGCENKSPVAVTHDDHAQDTDGVCVCVCVCVCACVSFAWSGRVRRRPCSGPGPVLGAGPSPRSAPAARSCSWPWTHKHSAACQQQAPLGWTGMYCTGPTQKRHHPPPPPPPPPPHPRKPKKTGVCFWRPCLASKRTVYRATEWTPSSGNQRSCDVGSSAALITSTRQNEAVFLRRGQRGQRLLSDVWEHLGGCADGRRRWLKHFIQMLSEPARHQMSPDKETITYWINVLPLTLKRKATKSQLPVCLDGLCGSGHFHSSFKLFCILQKSKMAANMWKTRLPVSVSKEAKAVWATEWTTSKKLFTVI